MAAGVIALAAVVGLLSAGAPADPPVDRRIEPRQGPARSAHSDPKNSPAELTPRAMRSTGELVPVAGSGRPSGGEPLRRFSIEVERGVELDRAAFARAIERTLLDPRGWTAAGATGLHRVASGPVDFRVVLASPATTDRLCLPLQTLRRYSCFQNRRVVLNAERWARGAASYGGRLALYRQYMVNHEVGHALGFGHAGCPAPGTPAPLMVQQTKGLQGCAPNPWPLAAERRG